MSKSLKADLLDVLIGLDHGEVKEMMEVDVDDVSAVDDPATGRRWRLFKRRQKQQDFPGLGSGAPGRPGGNSSLVDLARFLEANPTMTPAAAEAADAGNDALTRALRDDFGGAGDDATMSDPPTAGDFVSAKRVKDALRIAGIKGPKVEACVDSILSDPDFTAGDFDDRESRAFAICTAQFGPDKARKEAQPMGNKQDEPAMAEPGMEAAPAMAEVVEVPASPTQWPFAQCVSDAQGLGLGEDDAIGVCQLIRGDLKSPEDDDTILLPEGTTPEALITAAAMQLGLMKPEGAGGGGGEAVSESELRATPRFRFTGRNRWSRKLASFLGLGRPPSMEERRLRRMEREVSHLTKSNRDLMRVIEAQTQILARAVGVTDLPKLVDDEPAVTAPTAVADAAVAAADAAGDGKRAKAEPLTDDERAELERLRALEAELKTSAEGAIPDELDESQHGQFEPVADLGPAESAPAPEPELVGAGAGKIVARAKRQSVAPASVRKNGSKVEMVASTILGGHRIPKADREALGW